MKETNAVMFAIFLALGVMLIAGLVTIPAIDHAQAAKARVHDDNGNHYGQNKRVCVTRTC
jgi:hypothetical protein